MEIKINKKPVAVVKFDLKKFEEDMKKDFDLKKTVMSCMKVERSEFDTEKTLFDYIYISMDWGNLLMLYRSTRQDEMEIQVYRCVLTGFRKYNPLSINMEDGLIKLQEEEINEKVDFLVLNTFNSVFDKHIEYMLSQNLIDFANFKWKPEYTLGGP